MPDDSTPNNPPSASASGDRSVEIGGGANGATIISGDNSVGRGIIAHGDVVHGDKTETHHHYYAPAAQPTGAEQTPPRRIWNVAHRRNPNFTGRDELLDALRAALVSGRPAAVTQAVAGLGGVGKTQFATEYCYRHRDEYETVWWLRSEEASTLAGDYVSLGIKAGIVAPDERDQAASAAKVREWLEQATGWLLVFDNANNPGEIADYLPRTESGHVVVTTRHPTWGGVAEALAVQSWPEGEAAAFLCKRAKSADDTAARAIARFLGGLPLALAHAAAYVESTGCTLASYRKKLEANGIPFLAESGKPDAYHSTIETTWKLAIKRAGKTRGAKPLLEICAYLAPDDIPRDLLESYAEENGFDLDKAIAALRRYSLLETADGIVSVHRLVQAVVRDALGPDAARQAAAALGLLRGAYPGDLYTNHFSWPQCARLDPHVAALTARCDELALENDDIAWLLDRRASYHEKLGNYLSARDLFDQALRVSESLHGPDHTGIATRLSNLGNALSGLGDYAGAKAALERALRINEAALGPDHPGVATCLSNLGSTLSDLGDYAGAKATLERALRIDETALGPEHPNVATCLNNLGPVLHALGDYAGARAVLERALRIAEAVQGKDHPDVATHLSNLGTVLRDLRDYAGAKSALERALRIDEAVLGSEHPKVAIRLSNLGNLLSSLGDYAGAKSALERALSIAEVILGPDHPQVALYLSNLGDALRGLGDYGGAKAALERALLIDETALGPEHSNVAIRYNNLAHVLLATGDLVGARDGFAKTLAILVPVVGDAHPNVAVARKSLANVEVMIAAQSGGAD
jgi:tetratricopeptide (TPR) repeat protein